MWYLITSAKVYRMNVGKNEKKKERKEKHTNNELGIILLNQVLPSPSIRTSVWMKSDTQSKIQQTKSSIWISVIRMLIHRVMIENEISNKKKKYLYWLVCSRPFENLWLAVCDDFFFWTEYFNNVWRFNLQRGSAKRFEMLCSFFFITIYITMTNRLDLWKIWQLEYLSMANVRMVRHLSDGWYQEHLPDAYKLNLWSDFVVQRETVTRKALHFIHNHFLPISLSLASCVVCACVLVYICIYAKVYE